MSIRNDLQQVNPVSPAMQSALTIPQEAMTAAGMVDQSVQQQPVAEQHLAEANTFHNTSPDHPLTRNLVCTVRASLSDLSLRKAKAVWQPPSSEATKAILQQKKCTPAPAVSCPLQTLTVAPPPCAVTDLTGSSESQGDLKAVVLHKLTLNEHKSTFPVALGVRVTGVDDSTFSATGESYSTITLPNADSHSAKVLQEDDTGLGAPRLPPPASLCCVS